MGPRSDFSKPCQGAAEKSANATRKAPPKGWGEQSILSFAVFLPDAVQAICDQSLAVADGGAAGIPDGTGQVAGGVKGSLRAKLGAEPRGQTVQLAGGAQYKAVLQAGRGALAQNGRRGLCGKVDLRQLSGVLYSALSESCGPGRITPPTSSCFSLTAIMEMAVSAEMTTSGPALSARAATVSYTHLTLPTNSRV